MKNSSGIFSKPFVFVLAMAALFPMPQARAEGDAGASSKRSTDIQVTTSDIEPFSIDKKTDPDGGKPVFYSNGNTTIGFNDDGEPNVGTRF